MRYTVDSVKEQVANGTVKGFYGFWGTKNEDDMARSFSNFYKSPMNLTLHDGTTHTFDCNEQYFMYRKALLFRDYETMEKILVNGLEPMEYKKLGREVKNYVEEEWEAVRYQAMVDGLFYKFTQNPKLNKYLLSTGEVVLVEASPLDKVWGVGYRKSNPLWHDPYSWLGHNLMGFALMEVRAELYEAQKHEM